jgi:hypothetical protein
MNSSERGILCAVVALFRRIGPAGILALAALALAPSGALASGCPEQPLSQTFRPWLDVAWYVPAPNGGFEGGGEDWDLTAGAQVVDGNEPFLSGDRALALPGGASATSAPMCIGVEHPTIRLFARNTGANDSALAVSVVFRDPLLGSRRSLAVGLIGAGDAWSPTPIVPIAVNLLSLAGDQPVSFRFTAVDDRGTWTIDDVYVDPYKKR